MARLTKFQRAEKAFWPMPVSELTDLLEVSPQRVRQLIAQFKMKPVKRIGNTPLYSHVQYMIMEKRNTRPGPRSNGHKKAKRSARVSA